MLRLSNYQLSSLSFSEVQLVSLKSLGVLGFEECNGDLNRFQFCSACILKSRGTEVKFSNLELIKKMKLCYSCRKNLVLQELKGLFLPRVKALSKVMNERYTNYVSELPLAEKLDLAVKESRLTFMDKFLALSRCSLKVLDDSNLVKRRLLILDVLSSKIDDKRVDSLDSLVSSSGDRKLGEIFSLTGDVFVHCKLLGGSKNGIKDIKIIENKSDVDQQIAIDYNADNEDGGLLCESFSYDSSSSDLFDQGQDCIDSTVPRYFEDKDCGGQYLLLGNNEKITLNKTDNRYAFKDGYRIPLSYNCIESKNESRKLFYISNNLSDLTNFSMVEYNGFVCKPSNEFMRNYRVLSLDLDLYFKNESGDSINVYIWPSWREVNRFDVSGDGFQFPGIVSDHSLVNVKIKPYDSVRFGLRYNPYSLSNDLLGDIDLDTDRTLMGSDPTYKRFLNLMVDNGLLSSGHSLKSLSIKGSVFVEVSWDIENIKSPFLYRFDDDSDDKLSLDRDDNGRIIKYDRNWWILRQKRYKCYVNRPSIRGERLDGTGYYYKSYNEFVQLSANRGVRSHQ